MIEWNEKGLFTNMFNLHKCLPFQHFKSLFYQLTALNWISHDWRCGKLHEVIGVSKLTELCTIVLVSAKQFLWIWLSTQQKCHLTYIITWIFFAFSNSIQAFNHILSRKVIWHIVVRNISHHESVLGGKTFSLEDSELW